MASTQKKIVIVGGGPTGLGAALRLTDLGHTNWVLIDGADLAGGLSRSFVDEHGFTWDLGGHVIFSHYAYFDDAMNYAVQEWNEIVRESWVWVSGVWVPYPFQNNIHRLPNKDKQLCLDGLLDVYKQQWDTKPKNFAEYATRQFGDGIGQIFMRPYNFKVWAVPLELMSTEWTGERVATVDVKRVCKNIIFNEDDLGWGPNALFRFPVHGATGGIWKSIADKLPAANQRVGPGNTVKRIDADGKKLILANGETVEYDFLLSSIAFDDLLRITDGSHFPNKAEWPSIADKMVYSATNVIGLGIKGEAPEHLKTKCWMYFPQNDSPFYRATVFSNYSKFNAPDGHWSLMLEVSESTYKPVDQAQLMHDCIQGCIASDLIKPTDIIVSKWHHRLAKGYPTPFVGRNDLLNSVQPHLQAQSIYSRGRFGGWKYEVANQDHSMMQGVEAVEQMLGLGTEVTYHSPSTVNATKEMTRRLGLLKSS